MPDRGFASGQALGAAGGIVAGLAYAPVFGPPPPELLVVFAWLGLHGLFAIAALHPARDAFAKAGALVSISLLAAYLCVLTGGANSPFLVWLLALPADGALTRRPRMIALGVAASAFGIAAAALSGAFGLAGAALGADDPALKALIALSAALYAGLALFNVVQAERRAQLAARRGSSMVQALTDAASDVMARLGRDGRLYFVSPAAVRVLGFAPESLTGQVLFDVTAREDHGALADALTAAFDRAETVQAELRVLTAQGGTVWLDMRLSPIYGPEGDVEDVVAVMRDTTSRRAHEAALERARDLAEAANQSKSQFLANMSHELRTPLNAIIGFSDVMRQEMFGPLGRPKYNEYAGLIHESGRHLLDLIGDLLDMSKIEAGKYEISPEPVDPAEIASRALETLRVTAERKKVRLAARMGHAAGLSADKRALKQIMLNLLSNAVKFTPAGGTVSLETKTSQGWFVLEISDDGVGISAGDLARLGRPFEQAQNAESRNHEGTGLGLSLVAAFVKLHQGTMQIESALGEGTTVRIRLPQQSAAPLAYAAG